MTRNLFITVSLVALTGLSTAPMAMSQADLDTDLLAMPIEAVPQACQRRVGYLHDQARRAAEREAGGGVQTQGRVDRLEGLVAEEALAHAPPPPPPPAPPPPALYSPQAEIAMLAAPANRAAPMPMVRPEPAPRDRFEDVAPNPVQVTTQEPVSTFSIDVDTAAYAVVRNYLQDCRLPPSDAVRIEEMVNYFDYDYELPEAAAEPFATQVSVTPNPWNDDTRLMHVGIQGYDLVDVERPRANLVFLVDVSGSMNAPDKLPLALQAMHMLVDELHPDDTVSLVVYAGAAGAVLEPTEARDARRIHEALDRLHAGGSTAGGEGLALAYEFAERNFDADAVNRVMLLTDGDFNVGVTRDEPLVDFVSRKRETGIYLSVMGFGRGNYNDQMMQAIAQAGNGVAGYIDSRQEARRMLVEESFSALFPIAGDVKIQVEFNPERVAEYRLIGYETRQLERADFNNDQVDAGEVGSGQSVTAIYEIAAPGSEGVLTEPLRYGEAAAHAEDLNAEFAHLRVRYKLPGEDESRLIERPVTSDDWARTARQADPDARFAAQIAGFAQILRGDPYPQAGYDLAAIEAALDEILTANDDRYRHELRELVRIARFAWQLDDMHYN